MSFFLYNANGLPFWDETDLKKRDYFVDLTIALIKRNLLLANSAWKFFRFEAPVMIPIDLLNKEYTENNYYKLTNDLALRPETTPSSYVLIEWLLSKTNRQTAPLCVWQVGKSFRKEQDQPTKFNRFKEFYQFELQCAYTEDTKADYKFYIMEALRVHIENFTNKETRIIKSERLPVYSEQTDDIEVYYKDRWMEVCSISIRNDLKTTFKDKKLKVLEIAIGLDRIVNSMPEY